MLPHGHRQQQQEAFDEARVRAVLSLPGPLLEQRPAGIVVTNRTFAKAQALVASHGDWASDHCAAL